MPVDNVSGLLAIGLDARRPQPVYSDRAIETALALRLLFRLPLRQTEGFLHSLLLAVQRAL